MNEFGTVLNCMDGRGQRRVADYLFTTFGVRHLDTITAAGMVKHLASDTDRTEAIRRDLEVSLSKHASDQVAVAAHHDCAGNPVPDKTQQQQIVVAVDRLAENYPNAQVIGLWIDRTWTVQRIRP